MFLAMVYFQALHPEWLDRVLGGRPSSHEVYMDSFFCVCECVRMISGLYKFFHSALQIFFYSVAAQLLDPPLVLSLMLWRSILQ